MEHVFLKQSINKKSFIFVGQDEYMLPRDEGTNFIVVEQSSSVSVPTLIGENQQDFQSNYG